ncbi:hypothetical protein JHK87_055821 [Glycine soja]|nr:hypothetical protein JHK87_055821 [Glycine soja]
MCSCAPCHFSPSRAAGSRNLTISVTDSLTNATTMFHHRAIMVSPPPSPITSLGWTNCTNSMSSSFVARLLQLEVNRLEEEKTKEKDKKDDEKPDVAVSSELWPKMTERQSNTPEKDKERWKGRGSQEQQSQDGSSQSHSWYLPSVVSSPTSSRPVTPTASSSSLSQRPSSHVPPSKAVAVIAILKDKSVDELQKFLSDKDAYQQFLHSLDQVNIQTNVTIHFLIPKPQGFVVPKESQNKVAKFPILWTPAHLRHSDVVIAAITSCINTSNPSVMLGAALVAKKACELGLQAIQFGAVKDELNRPAIKVKNSLIFNAFVLCQHGNNIMKSLVLGSFVLAVRSRASQSSFPFACLWHGLPLCSAPPPRPMLPRTHRLSGRRYSPSTHSLCSPPSSPICTLELCERVNSSSPYPTYYYHVTSLS